MTLRQRRRRPAPEQAETLAQYARRALPPGQTVRFYCKWDDGPWGEVAGVVLAPPTIPPGADYVAVAVPGRHRPPRAAPQGWVWVYAGLLTPLPRAYARVRGPDGYYCLRC